MPWILTDRWRLTRSRREWRSHATWTFEEYRLFACSTIPVSMRLVWSIEAVVWRNAIYRVRTSFATKRLLLLVFTKFGFISKGLLQGQHITDFDCWDHRLFDPWLFMLCIGPVCLQVFRHGVYNLCLRFAPEIIEYWCWFNQLNVFRGVLFFTLLIVLLWGQVWLCNICSTKGEIDYFMFLFLICIPLSSLVTQCCWALLHDAPGIMPVINLLEYIRWRPQLIWGSASLHCHTEAFESSISSTFRRWQ